MNGIYESRPCPNCGRDFLFPAYGTRVCNDCRMGYDARWMSHHRSESSAGAPTGQSVQ
jgi:hypothetical protein